jgi:FkbM family methyltransferase
MKDIFYQIIYHPLVNQALRFLNKKFDFIIPFQLPVSGEIKVELSGGETFRMATNQTSYVTRLLYYEGAVAFEYTPVFEKLVKKCNTFIDIGANTGYYSLIAAQVSHANVLSFEPSSGPRHYLEKNVRINNLQHRVEITPFALSHETGELDFYAVKNVKYKNLIHNLGGVGSLQQIKKSNEVVKVQTTTLDEYMKSYKNDIGITLIKIDTEGTENSILEGCRTFIQQHKPVVICETLFNKIEGEIEKVMRSHDYLFFNFKDAKLHPTETLIRSVDNGVRDCFMVHPSRLHLIDEFIVK